MSHGVVRELRSPEPDDEWLEQSLIPLSLRSVYVRLADTTEPAGALAGRLGLRLRAMPLPAVWAAGPPALTTGKLGLRRRADAGSSLVDLGLLDPPKTESVSSQTESIREDRRPVDEDEELRRDDDRLAIRPRALMALPVFYRRTDMQRYWSCKKPCWMDGWMDYLPLAADDKLFEPIRGQFDGLHRLLGLGQPFVLEARLGRQPEPKRDGQKREK